MNTISYEFPLNEKCRTYLRVDNLFAQMQANQAMAETGQSLAFFKALFDFMELAERCDIRGDLSKDMERLRLKMQSWRERPGVDIPKLDALCAELQQQAYLLPRSSRPGSRFKEDKFLGALRQRFVIPGGLCPFDVPIFPLWLAQPQAWRQAQAQTWLGELKLLQTANTLLLDLWREQGSFQTVTAKCAFYQDAAEGCELLRLTLDAELGCYPTVSGHRSRFAIRFLPLADQRLGDIHFELARC